MTASRTETPPAVGSSISESPDLKALGLSDGHLRDAMAEIALPLLASGRSLVYGGDLRRHGFTELLAELVGRYRDHPRHRGTIAITDYLAWPVHIQMTSNDLAAFSAEHGPAVRLVFLTLDGARLARERRLKLPEHDPQEEEWTKGLTAMRITMCNDIQARIVLGGRVEDYRCSSAIITVTTNGTRKNWSSSENGIRYSWIGPSTRVTFRTIGLMSGFGARSETGISGTRR